MKPPVWQLVAIVGMAKSPHLWYTGRKNLSVSFMDEHISMAMTEVVQGKRRSLSPLEDRTFARVLEVIALGWTTGCGDWGFAPDSGLVGGICGGFHPRWRSGPLARLSSARIPEPG